MKPRPAGRALLPGPDADPRLRRGREDRHGPDLGRREEALEDQRLQLLVRRASSGAGAPTSSSRCGSRRAARRSSGSARSRCRSSRSSSSGASRRTRWRRSTSRRRPRARPPRPARPREPGLCDTPGRDHRAGCGGRRRAVSRRPPHRRRSRRGDGGHPAPPLRSTGPRRRRGLPPRDARLPLRRPAGRADGRAPLPRGRDGGGRRRPARRRAARGCRPRRPRRRHGGPGPRRPGGPPGGCGRLARTLRPPRRRRHGERRQDLHEGRHGRGVLGAAMPTLRNEGNQNNEIGLPLTLLRLRPEHRAAVLEMGMYVGGEIAALAALGRPSIGIVTAVAPVHLSRAGSLDAIEDAQGGAGRGAARRRHRDPERGRSAGPGVRLAHARPPCVTYGLEPGADVTADASRPARRRRDDVRPGRPRPPPGAPPRSRSARWAATACRTRWRPAPRALWRGSPTSESRPGSRRRGTGRRPTAAPWSTARRPHDPRRHATTPRRRPWSPLSRCSPRCPAGRVAVLGEMRELGAVHDEGHRAVGAAAARAAAELVVVGPAAAGDRRRRASRPGSTGRGSTRVADRDEAVARPAAASCGRATPSS